MKNTRLSARRLLQGSAAFAALGALGLATAMPAYADTYGWGYASAVGAENTVSETYITQDQTVSESFSSGIGDWLTVTGTTTATVNAEGATGTTVIDTAKVRITLDDLEEILDPEADEDEDEDEGDDNDEGDDEGDDDENEPSEEGEETGGEGADSDSDKSGGQDADSGGGDGGSEDTDSDDEGGGDGEGDRPEPTTPPAEDPTPSPSPSPANVESDEESVDTAAVEDEVIELNEENSELVDGGDTIVIEGTITGATVSTSQTWDGDVSHSAFEGDFQESGASVLSNGERVEVDIVPLIDEGVVQSEDAGFLWNDAYTSLYVGFAVNGEVVAGYPLAESAAGITIGAAEGDTGGGEGDEGGTEGDDKTPPKERDKDTLPKTDVKDAEPLAQTGSPVLGLIAAGTAIAAGGGAAAYLARRRKNNDEVAEAETTEG
ncbi:LPXTG cell wall anchor domain-containing protein [Nocardiopsis alkaliphila]|uniref:LPXTG cell wall anchor domain-containing protein n=1 Tax=Nocardiopsis alkaliphila TaxID=225762 RepID=UPI000344967E|nr:LPXTG cell wall anchor domain-containing protein [Nocardiopsis alkaliphila]